VFGLTRRERERLVASVPQWWHSIDVGRGVVTPGAKGAGTPGGPHAFMQRELESLGLPDLNGKTVLDIGALNGYYSFAAERLGASRVVALDYNEWINGENGSPPPGRAGFEVARKILKSRVEPVLGDLMEIDIGALGQFDVVLFLGVLYHLEDPLGGMRRVAELTSGLAVIETHAMSAGDADAHALFEFFAGSELNNDPTNWYVPNIAAIDGLCRAAGFASTRTLVGPPPAPPGADAATRHFRAVVHAQR
jgi:tRNA (mo5U34)-methyltransferase